MSLIFDDFPNMQQARKFRAAVKKRYGLKGQVFDNADEASALGGCWHPIPPVVHVDRVEVDDGPISIAAVKRRFGLRDQDMKAKDYHDHCSAEIMTSCAAEQRVIEMAKEFGGTWLGT
jgi:hypothetical protein